MQVVIRTDASLQMGTDHVMRCLTLANALNEKGATVEFICRDLPGNLIVYIENKEFTVHSSEKQLKLQEWVGVKSLLFYIA